MDVNFIDETASQLVLTLKAEDISIQPFAFKSLAYINKLIQIIKNQDVSENEKAILLIEYIWSHEAKEVALLLRNGCLQALKLAQFRHDGLRSKEDEMIFQRGLQKSVLEATTYLQTSLNNKLIPRGTLDENWVHELSPTPIILEQIETLADQIKKIQRVERKLYTASTALSGYRTAYLDHIKLRIERVYQWKHSLTNLTEASTDPEKQNGRKFIAMVDQYIVKFETEPILPSYEHIVLEDINRLNVPISNLNGLLEYKSIDVLSEISSWVSFHLDPALREIDEKLQAFRARFILVLIQITNRLQAKTELDDEEFIAFISELNPLLKTILKDFETNLTQDCLTKYSELTKSIEQLLITSQIFNKNSNFLPSTTISAMAEETLRSSLENRYKPEIVKQFLHQISGGIFKKYKAEEEISAAAYISKMLDFDPSSDNNSLFLKKGFLGNSFTIARPSLDSKIIKHFNLWQHNYCGALLITGGHNSGRSTIVENVPLLFADVKSHYVVQNQSIEIKGHKHVMSNDLMATLNFIVKYQGTERSIITLDNFTRYAKSSEAIFDLFNSLSEFIKKHLRKVYFVISIHNKLVDSLSEYYNFDNIFSEVIYTENMNVQLIEQALLIRARAVGKIDKLPALESEFVRYARKVAKQSQGKIGYAMQLWCVSKKLDGGFYLHLHFKEIVNRHHAILSVLAKCGALHFPTILSMLNEIDSTALRSDIQTLVELRILVRPEHGEVAINPYLQSTIELILY